MRHAGGVLRDAWRLAAPYFTRSEERWRARLLLVAIVVVILVSVQFDVILNSWRGQMYDSLQQYDLPGFIALQFWYRWDDKNGFMLGFVPLVSILVPFSVGRVYLQQLLEIRWRRWMTKATVANWMTDRAYYTIGLTRQIGDTMTDNPDQRISEDVRDFTINTIELGFQVLRRVISFVQFAIILWDLSGSIEVLGITIPGYMLFAAIIYALLGSWLTNLVGRPLVALNFLQQKAEADFRYSLLRLRENAEGVALSAGERDERLQLVGRFEEVAENWFRIMYRTVKLNVMSLVYLQAAAIVPIVLAAPAYFAKKIALGGMMRVVGAFSEVQDSLSWFVNAYQEIANWRATVNRLTTFRESLDHAHALSTQGPQIVAGSQGLSLAHAQIALPDGSPILDGADISVGPGQSVTISGNSGAGKSTIFRSIAGIWPFGSGQIERGPGTSLFLPQRPYIPLGTLRHAIAYPEPETQFSDAEVGEVLGLAGLSQLAARLDEDQPWAQILSGGEQQRLAIARALLQKPDYLFLDEATSALDPEAEEALYSALHERLPNTGIVSIAHRPDVARYHETALRFQRRPGEIGQLLPL